jgi:DNA-binding transcriptional ArsR family regulator
MDATELHGVLADRNRRRILDLVVQGERNVTDLVRATRLHQPLVSHHLRALRSAGLLTTRKEGRFRLYRVASKDLLARLVRLEEDMLALIESAQRQADGAQGPAPAKARRAAGGGSTTGKGGARP